MNQPPEEQQLPPYIIEGARSGRSRCKTCRRNISKGGLRLGILWRALTAPGTCGIT
jgi:hypothetical protein